MDNFNKYSIKTSYYICSDIVNKKNPIKYHNRFYNQCWERSKEKLTNLLEKQILKIKKLLIDTPKEFKSKLYQWTNTDHKYPWIYESYKIKHPEVNFDVFNDLYNKRKIDLYKIDVIDNMFDNSLDQEILEQLHSFQSGKFISTDVKLYVETKINRCSKYEFGHMNFYFFHNDQIDPQEKNDIVRNIYIISKWMYGFNPKYKINLSYFDVNIKKELNLNNQIDDEYKYLSSQNINSGSSMSGVQLMLWRREELYKVLIHELVHYNDIDLKDEPSIDNIYPNSIGKIDYPILVNEAITEIQAQFLHTLYLSTILSIKNNNNIIDVFKVLYNYEQIFSWYQFSKIMRYYSIKKFNNQEIHNKFNQSTNAFSYYILKSILTINFDEIILKFNHFNNNHNHPNLLTLIHKIIKQPPVKLINKIIKHLELDDNSLRMTLFG